MRPESAMGIDASLRGLALAVAPLGWDRDPKRVTCHTLSVPLKRDATTRDKVERLRMLALDVRTIAVRYNVRHAFVESYAFGMNTAAHSLGELGGVLKLELWRECQLLVETVHQHHARKLVYGTTPPRTVNGVKLTDAQRKAWLLEPLRAAGFELADHNQGDAVTTLMGGFERLGVPVISNLLGVEEKPKRSKRKAAA